MPLNRANTRVFHRATFAGQLETIRLLKRKDDQKQGIVTSFLLFNCRRSLITKSAETLQGDMVADHACVWHIPLIELERCGIQYLNSLDRIIQLDWPEAGRVWQPEATTVITVKMFGNELDLACLRVDPPTDMTAHG